MNLDFINDDGFYINLNNTLNNSCVRWRDFENFDFFFKCYVYLVSKNIVSSIFEILLIISIIGFNLLVIIRILFYSKLTIYNQIFIGICIKNFMTGAFELPFFHIENKFGYWGFGTIWSMAWAAYSSNLNTIVNFDMLYMSYVRYRSIKAPNSYKREIMFRKPFIIMIFIWIFSISVWFPVTFYFRTFRFTSHIDYHPHFVQTILNFFTWTMPILLVGVFSALIIIKLAFQRKLKIKKFNNKLSRNGSFFSRNFIGPKGKFTIITLIYLTQWIAPSIFILIEPFLEYHNERLILIFKWSTYTVCLTDSVVILLLDTNQSFFSKRKNVEETQLNYTATFANSPNNNRVGIVQTTY